MAVGASISSLPSLYKTLFMDEEVLDLTYGDNNVLWAMMEKDPTFGGDAEKVPIEIAPPGGRSHDFATALALAGVAGTAKHFLLTRTSNFQLIQMDGESIEAATDEGAFVDLFEDRTKAGLKQLGRTINWELYRSGSGSRGQVGSLSTTALTLLDANDAISWEVGMTVSAGPNDSSTSLRVGSAQITSIDRENGILYTTGSNWATQITSLTANDYIFAKGDPSVAMPGLAGYVPNTAPVGGDSFYSLDRSVDTDRLAGIRAGDLSGYDLSEALLTMNYKILTRGGGLVSANLMHTLKFSELVKSYASRTIPYVTTTFGKVGFKGITVVHAGGESTVYGDRDCQFNTMWGIDPKVMCFRSLKMAPRPLDYKETTRNGSYVDPNNDGLVLRLGYRGALRVRAPGRLGRATI